MFIRSSNGSVGWRVSQHIGIGWGILYWPSCHPLSPDQVIIKWPSLRCSLVTLFNKFQISHNHTMDTELCCLTRNTALRWGDQTTETPDMDNMDIIQRRYGPAGKRTQMFSKKSTHHYYQTPGLPPVARGQDLTMSGGRRPVSLWGPRGHQVRRRLRCRGWVLREIQRGYHIGFDLHRLLIFQRQAYFDINQSLNANQF